MKKSKQHSFSKWLIAWWYCSHCGLMTLKNEATQRAMKAPCPGHDDD